jgi:hypothetical protein
MGAPRNAEIYELMWRVQRRRRSAATKVVFALFVLAFYYDWYCYPFKMGSTMTSPTYRDTPGWISAIKYILCFLVSIYAIATMLLRQNTIRIRRPIYVAAYCTLFVLPLLYGTFAVIDRFSCQQSFAALPLQSPTQLPLERIYELGMFFAVPLLLHALPSPVLNLKPIVKLIGITLLVYLATDAFEVTVFLVSGRLPAEGYEGSILVRFGSLMDKPNYFGILTAMFFGFIFGCKWRLRNKLFSSALLFIALLLTLSFTAWTAVTVACAIYGLVRTTSRLHMVVVAVLFLGVGFLTRIVVTTRFERFDVIDLCERLLEAKSESIDTHEQGVDVLEKSFGFANLVGLEPHFEATSAESQYVEVLLTEGVIYLFIFLLIMADGLYHCGRILRNPKTREDVRVVTSAAFCLLVAMLVSGVGLPVLAMFPLNLLTPLMLGIVSSGTLSWADDCPLDGALAPAFS